MTRTKLADRALPDYTRGEETANTLTHLAGALFGAAALVLCVLAAGRRGGACRIAGAAVYGASLLLLYTVSAVYHGLKPCRGKKVLQVTDHCSIYLLIAGTYTPVVLGPIRDTSAALGWTIFGVVWGLSAFAAVFTAIDHNKYKKLSMACYLAAGWAGLPAVRQLVRVLTLCGVFLLLAGGVAYTAGAVCYSLGGRRHIRWMHPVFHIFVLLGSVLHFLAVYRFCF